MTTMPTATLIALVLAVIAGVLLTLGTAVLAMMGSQGGPGGHKGAARFVGIALDLLGAGLLSLAVYLVLGSPG
jgi:hypothetical protein